MGQIHELVAQHGRDTARRLVPFEEKRLVDLAADVLADEKVAAGFTYSGFCMASLPHRSLPDNSEWVRKSEDFSLIIEPGKLFRHGEEDGTLYGVPFGHAPCDPTLPTERSDQDEQPRDRTRQLDAAVARPHGNRTRRQDVSSLPRSGSPHKCLPPYLCLQEARPRRVHTRSIVDGGLSLFDITVDGRQGRLWKETVLLGEKFFQSLKKHPVLLWDGP